MREIADGEPTMNYWPGLPMLWLMHGDFMSATFAFASDACP